MFVTYVEGDGPFVRLWLQEDSRASSAIESMLAAAAPRLHAMPPPPPHALIAAPVFAARIKDSFYRARLAAPPRPPNPLRVRLLDFGTEEELGPDDLRLLDGEPKPLRDVPPCATDILLSRVVHPNGSWEPDLIDYVRKVCYRKPAQCHLDARLDDRRFASVRIQDRDLSDHLVEVGVAARADPPPQRRPRPPQPQPTSFDSRLLPVGSDHAAIVTHEGDGPELFAVRLLADADAFEELRARLANAPLRNLSSPASVGNVCLGRLPDGDAVARAIVTGCTASHCTLFYVDYGFAADASCYDVFRAPDDVQSPAAFALRFRLAGLAGRTVTESVRRAFASVTEGRRVALRVCPPEGPPLLQYCSLQVDGRDVAKTIFAETPGAYRRLRASSLVGETVTVSFVDSCAKFFVQPIRSLERLDDAMREVAEHCARASPLAFRDVRPGAACCALFPEDQRWYRAQVANIKRDKIVVYYVDYGNEQEVECDHLRTLPSKLLNLEAQAVQCALKGYESRPFDVEASRTLESLTLERDLKITVCGTTRDDVPLVELTDETKSPPIDISALLANPPKAFDDPPKNTNSDHNSSYEFESEPMSSEPSPPKNNNHPDYDKGNKHFQKPSKVASNDTNRQPHRRKDANENKGKSFHIDSQTIKQKSNFNRKKSQGDADRPSGSVPKRHNRPREFGGDRQQFNNPRHHNNDRPHYNSDQSRPNSDRSQHNGDQIQSNTDRQQNHSGRPQYNNDRPQYNNDRPQYNSDRPQYNNDRPQYNNDRPQYNNDRKQYNNDRQPYNNDRQPYNNDRQPYNNDRQQYNNDRQQYNNDRPQYNNQSRGGRNSNPNRSDNYRSPNDLRLARARDLIPASEEVHIVQKQVNYLKSPVALNSFYDRFVNEVPCECNVQISWIISPNEFYVQNASLMDKFRTMMLKMPTLYEGVQPIEDEIPIGSCVVAQFPMDSVLYRAIVLQKKGMDSYFVHFVDYGNKCLVKKNKLWQLESELFELPAMSEKCSLKDVVPINKWSTNHIEDQYFKESEYKCTFHSKISDDLYAVSLINLQNEHVDKQLISSGLACTTNQEKVPWGKGELVDINTILGQCFYSQLIAPESMSKFYICLNPPPNSSTQYEVEITSNFNEFYCNQAVQCSLYKVDENNFTNTGEFKTQLENRYVIVYIDNITENGLAVTLYDAQKGNRYNFFKDEDAVECVPPLCPHPVFNQFFGDCYVAHIESANEIYLQKSITIDILNKYLEDLYQFYESEGHGSKVFVPEIDALCAAKSADGNWYRAKVVKKLPSECQVHYIDYGNKEIISVENLTVLDSRFFNPSEMSLLCSLDVSPFEVDVADLKQITDDKILQVEVTMSDIGWISTILIDDQNIIASLKSEGQLSSGVDMEDKLLVYVSHIDSPGQFWLQLVTEEDNIESLGERLKNAETFDDMTEYDVGTECIARYSADEVFYRAVVLDSDSDITTVRFIDFGNTDVLDNGQGLIKQIPKEISELPPYALKCGVNASPAGTGEWTEQASELFTKLIGDTKNSLHTKIILKDAITYVDLFVNKSNITEELVKAGFATATDKQSNGKLPTGYASHVNSPSEFWIQLESAVTDLESVSEQLINADDFPPITEIEEGIVCAAKFPEDGCWYRAKIIIHGSEGTEVIFMDYGNASLTTELRSLPESLKNFPALSRKCALQKPTSVDVWSKEAEIKFSEIAAEGATIFEVLFIASGDTSIVDLFYKNESITETIVNLQKDLCSIAPLNLASDDDVNIDDGIEEYATVHISHSYGPNDFWVQYESNAQRLSSIMNSLVNAEHFEDLDEIEDGGLCVSLFSEDNLWYRSVIINKGELGVQVRHIDYGKTAVSATIKEMPLQLQEILPLAVHCSLCLPISATFSEINHEKFIELTAKTTNVYYLEKIDADVDPVIVNLFTKDGNEYINVLNLIDVNLEQEISSYITDQLSLDENLEKPEDESKFKSDEYVFEKTEIINVVETHVDGNIVCSEEVAFDNVEKIINVHHRNDDIIICSEDAFDNVEKILNVLHLKDENTLTSDEVSQEFHDKDNKLDQITTDSSDCDNVEKFRSNTPNNSIVTIDSVMPAESETTLEEVKENSNIKESDDKNQNQNSHVDGNLEGSAANSLAISEEKEDINISEPITISEEKHDANISEPITVSEEKEDINISEPITISEEKHDANISEPITVSEQKEDINISEPITVSEQKEDINISEPIMISEKKEDINISEPITISEKKHDANIAESITISEEMHDANIAGSIESSKVSKNIDSTELESSNISIESSNISIESSIISKGLDSSELESNIDSDLSDSAVTSEKLNSNLQDSTCAAAVKADEINTEEK